MSGCPSRWSPIRRRPSTPRPSTRCRWRSWCCWRACRRSSGPRSCCVRCSSIRMRRSPSSSAPMWTVRGTCSRGLATTSGSAGRAITPPGGSEKSWLRASSPLPSRATCGRWRRCWRRMWRCTLTAAARCRRWRGRSTAGSGWRGPCRPECPRWHALACASRSPRSTASPARWRSTRRTGWSGSWGSTSPTARSRRSTPSPTPTSYATSTGSTTSLPAARRLPTPRRLNR